MLSLIIFAVMVGHISCSTCIIEGQFASPGQFPYQISLQQNEQHICGGAFVSNDLIVTAAHCTYGRNPTELRVVAGTTDLLAGNGKSFSIDQFIMHPQYNHQTHDFDMSLIRLTTTVPLGLSNIDKIELASADDNFPAYTTATVSGFGAVNANLQLPNKLRYAYVPLLGRDICNPQVIPGITDRMICAGQPSGQVSSWLGDSGEPLTVQNKLFGVASFGFGCGVPGPAMYTSVSALRSWIKEVSGV